jgi:DNA-binding transcriptional ArsR family regulator
MKSPVEPDIQRIPIEDLRLDSNNPRLPEDLVGADQGDLLRYLYEHGVLEELGRSFVDNGYFVHEPLIATPEDGAFVVLEGNRRLAALLILHRSVAAGDIGFVDIDPTADQLARLRETPCYVIESREAVHRFLGFRHIGGIKTWSAEAKARYLLQEVDRAAEEGAEDPFREVARRVGSNAQGVRNSYIAIRLLVHARDELEIDTRYVQHERFGVWERTTHSKDVRGFINFGTPRAYQGVMQALEGIDAEHTREVLNDLKPQPGYRQAVLSDSRDVTDYGRVLANESARRILRESRDLSLARQVIDQLSMPDRVKRLADSGRVLLGEISAASLDRETLSQIARAAQDLQQLAGDLRSLAKGRLEIDD